MSEAADYKPAPHWKGHDFKSAKAAVRDRVGRTYDDAVRAGVTVADCVPKEIETDCEAPVVFVLDDTGSMGPWPAVIKAKFAYFEDEAKEYLGDDMRVSFCFVGDAFSDTYPLQVRSFLDGPEWPAVLDEGGQNALILEGGGGGTSQESYDLAALYYARNCHMPKATRKPLLIFIGDEGLYNFVDREAASTWAHVDVQDRPKIEDIFEELKAKFSVYIVRKPYQSYDNNRSESDIRIQSQWEKLLGEDHVVSLPNAERVVDVIFGIFAAETDRVEYFEDELVDRQSKDDDGDEKIGIVMDAVKSIHDDSRPKSDGSKSVSVASGGDKSISLLDD
jgi:hypothetical protein